MTAIYVIVLWVGALSLNTWLEDGSANMVESMILLILVIIYAERRKKK